MATHHFGTGVDASQYIEDPQPGDNPPKRPAANGPLYVRNGTDHTALAPTTFDAETGYFTYTTEDIPEIEVSTSNGDPWVPLVSIEGQAAGAVAGATAAAALAAATQASRDAAAALAASGSAGVTIESVGPATSFTLAQIHARDLRVPIHTGDMDDLALVGISNQGSDLSDYGAPNGVAPLGSDGKLAAQYGGGGGSGGGEKRVYQNADFTIPARSTVSTDPTEVVVVVLWYRNTDRPVIGTDLSTYFRLDPANGIPGDDIEFYGP